MRTSQTLSYLLLALILAGNLIATTVNPTSRYAYGANTGFIDAGDSSHGLVVGHAYCSGYMYAANTGWIHCGNSTPDNGYQYGNDSSTDFGINHDGFGNLTGTAYGSNIGWIVFEQTHGQPRVDLSSGDLSGHAWSANCGWIDLGNIKTNTILPSPDMDGDGIPDSWELAYAPDLKTLGDHDSDGDGISDLGEYDGGTHPLNPHDYIRIIEINSPDGKSDLITWTCTTNRVFQLITAESIGSGTDWFKVGDAFIPATGPTAQVEVEEPLGSKRFYRVIAEPPLLP
jgi:hypothetical protein